MNKKSCTLVLLGSSAWLSIALFGACRSDSTHPSADVLQGYWENEDCSVSISGNSLYFYERDDFWYQTEFTISPGTEPMQLHAKIVKDSSEDQGNIGDVVDASFKVEDGILTLIALADGEPPADGSGRYVLGHAEPREGRTGPPISE